MRKSLPDLRVLVVEPKGSPVLSCGTPSPHKLVGTIQGFIPPILNQIIYDDIVQVSAEDALQTLRATCQRQGILVVPSSGASVWTELQEAKRLGKGKRVLCIVPDNGERYLSSDIF